MARPEKKNTTEAPRIRPTRTSGRSIESSNDESGTMPVPMTAVRKEPNSDVAASTAVAIAMPLVMALVVLPTASSEVSAIAPGPPVAPDISAMPCALSATGPKVSIETMTPTVVSRPVPASATANSETVTDCWPSRKAE